MKADGPRKRRRYTIAEVEEILQAVEEVGVVEAARRHGVPQTTVSSWLHRDAAKVTTARAGASTVKPTRKPMHQTSSVKATKATAGLRRTAAPKVTVIAKATKTPAGLNATAAPNVCAASAGT